jgi:Gas vesicle synthesis protein GvpL/GvpF
VPRQAELSLLLSEMTDKAEVRVKSVYLPDVALRDAVMANPAIERMQARIKNNPASATFQARLHLGELAAAGIEGVKKADERAILDELSARASAARTLAATGEHVAVHAAFLVEEGRLADFDAAVDRIATAQTRRMRFELVGPLAPWDFVELGPIGEAANSISSGRL